MPELPAIDARRAEAFVADLFDESIIQTLSDYIEIPNKSPAFDPDWEDAGHMRHAMNLLVTWCRANGLEDMALEVVELPGRTPLLLIEIPGEVDDTVLLYGHMDIVVDSIVSMVV